MATTIGKLAVILSANAEPLKTGLDSATAKLKGWNGTLTEMAAQFKAPFQGVLRSAESFAKQLPGPLGKGVSSLLSMEKIGGWMDDAKESLKELATDALKFGTTMTQMSAVTAAAGPVGDKFGVAFGKLQTVLGQASAGNMEAITTLRHYGLSWQELERKNPTEQLQAIADKYKAISSQAERTNMLTKLFGEQGLAMAGMFAKGGQGIADQIAKADKMGLIVTQSEADLLKASEAADKEFKKVGEGAGRQMAIAAAAIKEPFQTAFLGIAQEFGTVFKSIKEIAMGFGEALGGIFELLKPVVATFGAALKVAFMPLQAIGKLVGGIGSAIKDFAKSVGKELGEAFGGFGKWVASGFGLGGNKQLKGKMGVSWTRADEDARLKDRLKMVGGDDSKLNWLDRRGVQEMQSREFLRDAEKMNGARIATDDMAKSIREATYAIGKTPQELQLFQLGLKGASKAQMEQVKQLQKEFRAAEVKEAVRSPLQNFEREMSRLNELKDVLSPGDFALRSSQIFEQLGSATDAQRKPLPTADTFGSQAAQSAITAFLTGRQGEDPQERVERVMREAKEIQDRQLRVAERTLEALEGRTRLRLG